MKYLLIFLLTLILTGCLTFEQAIRINNDNTVLVSYTYTYQLEYEDTLRESITRAIAANSSQPAKGLAFFDEKGISDYCQAHNIELRQYKRSTKNSKATVQIIMLARKASPETLMTLCGLQQKGKRLEMQLPPIEWRAQIQQEITKLCPDMTFSMTLSIPGKIKSTNGTLLRNDTANWTMTPKDGTLFKGKTLFIEW